MTFQQLTTQLRKSEYKPIYLLHGEEPYFIDAITDLIEAEALPEAHKEFNFQVLYGKDIDSRTLTDYACRLPMMATHQVIIVKEAQMMSDIKKLETYASKPLQSTLLVLCHKHKKLTAAGNLLSKINANGIVFESKRLYENQLFDWIKSHADQEGLTLSDKATELIIDYLGTDISTVVQELEKVKLSLPKGTTIETKHIEELIGISREYNIFELNKALANRDKTKVARIINNFAANPRRNPPSVVITALANYFIKVYQLHYLKNAPDEEVKNTLDLRNVYALREYRLAAKNYPPSEAKRIISVLKTYDLMSKGVGYVSTGKDETALLKELVWKILSGLSGQLA